jgi:hypothetical protein
LGRVRAGEESIAGRGSSVDGLVEEVGVEIRGIRRPPVVEGSLWGAIVDILELYKGSITNSVHIGCRGGRMKG